MHTSSSGGGTPLKQRLIRCLEVVGPIGNLTTKKLSLAKVFISRLPIHWRELLHEVDPTLTRVGYRGLSVAGAWLRRFVVSLVCIVDIYLWISIHFPGSTLL